MNNMILRQPYQHHFPPGTPKSVNIYSDGSPASVHTYDGVEYLPEQDALLMAGGPRWIDSNGVQTTAIFDFEKLKWSYGEEFPVGVVSSASAYDAANERMLYWGNARLAAFNPVKRCFYWGQCDQ